MADIYSKKKRGAIMSMIRSKNSVLEKEAFAYLRRSGIHFRKHYDKIVGKPDIAIPTKKRAVFIDGDFWHGWYFTRWKNKLPSDFWREKISANIRRNRKNFTALRRSGWKVLRIWGHQLGGKNKHSALERIETFLS